ncbi:GNAT family N-acetyltransferase [Mesorhizobium sp. CA8]|uniref:GNAT family N-acetyltransferase n=1 Tax=unclassified Mesorhizobium TaxID=325217 RepID=UPI001CCCE9D2|nr:MULTISPECIES: GNAT family N-acetyltransferase [unclassified Mesorhizobium]MBZ9761756.1 GNAT family N-acetyltransferase [Mesorhizobium sp. CA8]MBZ9820491.1 GNAT family N-acetyltransferase [Mesorhizobium sp. CA4]
MVALETPRLFIRPLVMSNLDDVHRLHTDPLVVQSLFFGEPPSRQNTQEKMDQYVQAWRQNGFGFFGVFLKGNSVTEGEFAGRAGLRYFEDTVDVEYGLCLFGHVAGRGLGPELGAAILRYAFEELGLERVVALVRPDNERAVRAAEKIGFTHIEDRQYGDRVKGFYEVRPSQYGVVRQSGGPRSHAG